MTLADIATLALIISVVLALLLMPAAKQTQVIFKPCIGYCPAAK